MDARLHTAVLRRGDDISRGPIRALFLEDDPEDARLIEEYLSGNKAVSIELDRLMEEEVLYRFLFDHSPDGVLLLDPQTLLPQEFNAAACQQLGYTAEEFRQVPMSATTPARRPTRFALASSGCCARGGSIPRPGTAAGTASCWT